MTPLCVRGETDLLMGGGLLRVRVILIAQITDFGECFLPSKEGVFVGDGG